MSDFEMDFWEGPYHFGGSLCCFYNPSFYDTKKSVFGKRILGGQSDPHKLSTGKLFSRQ